MIFSHTTKTIRCCDLHLVGPLSSQFYSSWLTIGSVPSSTLTRFLSSILQFKLKPFTGARIHFHGFCESEYEQVLKELVRNGGVECATSQDPTCTHIVVDVDVKSLPAGFLAPQTKAAVVKVEWFWASIQVSLIFICLTRICRRFDFYFNLGFKYSV